MSGISHDGKKLYCTTTSTRVHGFWECQQCNAVIFAGTAHVCKSAPTLPRCKRCGTEASIAINDLCVICDHAVSSAETVGRVGNVEIERLKQESSALRVENQMLRAERALADAERARVGCGFSACPKCGKRFTSTEDKLAHYSRPCEAPKGTSARAWSSGAISGALVVALAMNGVLILDHLTGFIVSALHAMGVR